MMPVSSRRSSIGSRSSILGFKLRRNGLHNENPETTRRLSRDNNVEDGGERDGIVKVPVIGYEVMEARERFTVYKLQIENEELEDSWLVCRRYTDFQRLAAKLKEEFPDLFISLPPKRWLKNNFDTSFLDDRMKGIQAFVDSILVQHQLASSPTVRAFFCLDEPPMYPENVEESRAMFGTVEDNVAQLKDIIHEKDDEIDLLKAQLEVAKSRNDALTKKLNRACRACNHRILSNSTLSSLGKNGTNIPPIQTSTPRPNFEEGPETRVRNRSSRSDTSSILVTPTAERLTSESNLSCPGSLESQTTALETVSTQLPATSTPVHMNQSVTNSDSFSTPNVLLLTNSDNTLSNISPGFEIISSPSFASQEVDRNSSFEILSPSSSESDPPEDSKHSGKVLLVKSE